MLLEKISNFFGFKKIIKAISSRWTIKNSYRRPIPKQNPVPVKKIDYLIVDPTLPNLTRQMEPPQYNNNPSINVRGYKGAGFSKNSVEGQSANCFVTIVNTINYLNSKTKIVLPKWPGTSSLQIFPRAGVDLNAYYDRSSLRFFYYTDARIGGTIFACDSTDIVAHELGHAVLDAYRPETWSAVSLEVASFHEAFADLVAILHALTYDEVLQLIISETNGNLKKENIASRLAEQFGQAIYKISRNGSGRLPSALRSAINDFKYVNPSSLPDDAPNDQLAQECHSFGRIFLGAFYDMLSMIFDDIKSTGVAPVEALKQARDTLATYALKAIQNAPLNSKFYSSVAKTILWVDATVGGMKYQTRIQQIFKDRNLTTTQLMALSAPKCDNPNFIVKKSEVLHFKLIDRVVSVQSNNPLYSLDLEVPNESAFLYDSNGNIFDSITTIEEEAIMGAVDMINYLQNTNNVSSGPETLFEVQDGKLIRSHFSHK